jgi:hypothetical protein
MLYTFERMGALLVVIKLAAVALDDCQQLNHVMVGISLDVCIRSLDFAVQLHQALSKNEGIGVLLVLNEQEDSLLGFLDILLPQEYFFWVNRPSLVCCCFHGFLVFHCVFCVSDVKGVGLYCT